MAITASQTGTAIIKVTGTTATADEILPAGHYYRLLWVHWYLPTTADHKFSLIDGSDNQILKGNCVTVKESLWYPCDGTFHNGLFCDDLDSGELYIAVVVGRKPS